MGSGDFTINAHTRQVLARHWIEVESLVLIAANGVLTIGGRLLFRYRKGGADAVGGDFLSQLETELKAIRGLKRIRWQLENWQRTEEGWVPAAGEGKPEAAKIKPTTSAPPEGS